MLDTRPVPRSSTAARTAPGRSGPSGAGRPPRWPASPWAYTTYSV